MTPNHIEFVCLSFLFLILSAVTMFCHSQVKRAGTATQVELLACHLQDRQSVQ